MDCFPGAVTSVDADMTYDRCVETTLHDVNGSRDIQQAEVADETIPNTGYLDDEDDNTLPQRGYPGRQRRNVRQPRRLNDFLMRDELENLALHSETLVASTVPWYVAEVLADPKSKAAMQRE